MKILSVLLCCLLLAGCAPRPAETVPATVPPETAAPTSAATAAPTVPPETAPQKDAIDLAIEDMSLEQRVGQLFLARCNKDTVLTDLSQYHLGGLVLFGEDFEGQTPETMTKLLTSYQAAADYPLLLAVDEEGGDVTRISRNSAFRDKRFSSLRARWNRGGLEAVLSEEEEKCQLLAGLGINVNLGPVCDIATDPSAFLYNRSLGQDAETTAQVISSIVSLMNQEHIGSVLKHFPGYGNNADTHTGIALDSRSLSELEENDLLPFAAGIQAGCGAVMVGHVIVEAMDDSLPASLSPAVHRYLRETMGFTGVIMTDDLVMQAITDQYGAGEAAVMAVLAGNDLLCATEYTTQYPAVLQAVLDGRISVDTLNAAVRHVLEWKQQVASYG
ncbi:MAG TPA: beta-hexosaminidase [Clostridiales bacterium]|nr:beta-hexosaminidase [Clostridiales bacterium]